MSLAALWNRELAARAGDIYAREWRARGIHFMLAPGVNVYRACLAMGFFDRDQVSGEPLFNPEADEMALKAAEEGIVLLKNDQRFLPLDTTRIKTVAVIGPTASPAFISDRIHSNKRIIYGGGESSSVFPFVIRLIFCRCGRERK